MSGSDPIRCDESGGHHAVRNANKNVIKSQGEEE
jgi:hypothetical protein